MLQGEWTAFDSPYHACGADQVSCQATLCSALAPNFHALTWVIQPPFGSLLLEASFWKIKYLLAMHEGVAS